MLLGAGGLSGCGGSDADTPGDTVVSYLRAFGLGDGEVACDRLTEATERVIAPRVAEKLGGKDCPDAIRGLSDRLTVSQANGFKKATVTRVKERGKTADVRFRAGQARGVARLTKGDDGWKISLVPETR